MTTVMPYIILLVFIAMVAAYFIQSFIFFVDKIKQKKQERDSDG